MSTFLTAKNVLLNYDFENPTDEEGKKSRGTALEFQDYAYRLAADLNDLEHISIYMRFAKKYPRALLERVYEFIADINEDNKGKLFMWKFKQIRDEYQLKLDLKNFSYDFVLKKMKILRDELAESLYKKSNSLEANQIAQFLISFDLSYINQDSKVLFIGNTSYLVPSLFSTFNCKLFGTEISKALTIKLKDQTKNTKGAKFIQKDFLKNTYKNNYFDLVIIEDMWSFIPLEAEKEFIAAVFRVLKPGSKLIIQTKISTEEAQEWVKFNFRGEDRYFFKKVNLESNLKKLFGHNGFDIISENSSEKGTIYTLERI